MLHKCHWQTSQFINSLQSKLHDLPEQTHQAEPKRYRFLIVDPNLQSLENEVNSFVADNPSYSVSQVVSVAGSGFLVVLEGGR